MIVMWLQRVLHSFGIDPSPCRLLLLSHSLQFLWGVFAPSSDGQQSQFLPGLRCIFDMHFPVKVLMPELKEASGLPRTLASSSVFLHCGWGWRAVVQNATFPHLPKWISSPSTNQLPSPDPRDTSEALGLQCFLLTALYLDKTLCKSHIALPVQTLVLDLWHVCSCRGVIKLKVELCYMKGGISVIFPKCPQICFGFF